jgi:hypothetical protein
MKLRIAAAIVGGLDAFLVAHFGGGFFATAASGIFSGFLVGIIYGIFTRKS